jgi:hypothetical protein
MVEDEEGHDHEHDEDCPLCRGEELSPEFVQMILEAGAQSGRRMTPEEFFARMDSLSRSTDDD